MTSQHLLKDFSGLFLLLSLRDCRSKKLLRLYSGYLYFSLFLSPSFSLSLSSIYVFALSYLLVCFFSLTLSLCPKLSSLLSHLSVFVFLFLSFFALFVRWIFSHKSTYFPADIPLSFLSHSTFVFSVT